MAAKKSHSFAPPKQCLAVTKRGTRCTFSSASTFQDQHGYDVAAPLRNGCDYCRVHLSILATTVADVSDVVVFYLDFETSGLDVLADHIVEIGLLCESGECFATVCCPPIMTPGPQVHGIENEELASGPCFVEAFARMVRFVEERLLVSVQSDESSDEEISAIGFKDELPSPVMVAHNGSGFDFPFLLSECHRNNLNWDSTASWDDVDTLDLVKAADFVLGSCQKLQCLLHQAAVRDLQAHRALDC